ncbi:hypothetical protein Scep_028718 [Stephania cephalantha]|uniref:Bifunctional inhibitor/plant lipid transfer protein/seed storage helical domain-containing protein n=1 Tax=Stephania cephalantha TaxID=152367 RepID=A0AAP0EAF9_9MAGN
MARPALAASALLAAAVFLVAAEASIYRTEVSQGGGMPEQCQEEIMQADMRHCEDYIRQASQHMLKSMVNNQQQRQQVPQMCCSQLRQMRMECRCPAAMQAMGGYGGQESYMEGAYRAAAQMTGMCGLEPHHCSMRQEGY